MRMVFLVLFASTLGERCHLCLPGIIEAKLEVSAVCSSDDCHSEEQTPCFEHVHENADPAIAAQSPVNSFDAGADSLPRTPVDFALVDLPKLIFPPDPPDLAPQPLNNPILRC